MKIADRIKAVRKRLNMNQTEFAKTIGVKLLSVSRYETGVRFPGHETLVNFRKNIQVDTNWLLTGEGSMFGYGEQVSIDKEVLLKVGDIVELISGSKPMTVIQANPKEVTCTWPNANDDLQTSKFPVGTVRRVDRRNNKNENSASLLRKNEYKAKKC